MGYLTGLAVQEIRQTVSARFRPSPFKGCCRFVVLPRRFFELIEHRQTLQRPPIARAVTHDIVAP